MLTNFLRYLAKPVKKISQLQKAMGMSFCAALIALSVFLMSSGSALAAQCHDTDNVQGGDIVFLQDEDDIYTGKPYSGVSYYWVTTTVNYDKAGRHQISGAGDLSENDTIKLETLDKDGWETDWLDRDLVGAFSKHDLYYWSSDYDSNTNWILERPSTSTETGEIKYGEDIYLVNQDYNEYLDPDYNGEDDGYMTTNPTPHIWTILEYCP